ncbi:cupredoxin domain-containing protein [Candidatus Uhrbacteria bacterium]|nr:cupredoxin domain-containing protein [Candidatus Uhrbacteria bacterium]
MVVRESPIRTSCFVFLAAVILLGAGCKQEPSVPSSATSPAPRSAPVFTLDGPSAGLVAPAPTTPPPPDIPNVPSAPPSAADAIAPTPPPTQPIAPPSQTQTTAPAIEAAPAPAADAAPQVIRITAKQWEFVPAEIRVRKDTRVILEVTSTDVDHGLSIPDFTINRTLRPGATERIEFTPDKTGSFSMVCSVFCGQGHRGMRGTLIVE